LAGSISEQIASAEEKWLEEVGPFVSNLFEETFLPSHDQNHARRVWSLCKRLLLELEDYDSLADQGLVEGLLLASWFHDTGMVDDPGEKHGVYGGEIFERFIGEHPMREARLRKDSRLYKEVRHVIKNHDTKGRSLYPELKPGKSPAMMAILSIADDLDALGTVGIYRYSEIYLKRGLPPSLLGIKVLSNVRRRFKNILESCAAFPTLMVSYRDNYLRIEQFFNRYNQLLLTVKESDKVQWGELGVVNYIRVYSVEGKIRPEDFYSQPGIASSGSLVKTYFKKLQNELELFV
jgi:HD superfamily phosphodiesterase